MERDGPKRERVSTWESIINIDNGQRMQFTGGLYLGLPPYLQCSDPTSLRFVFPDSKPCSPSIIRRAAGPVQPKDPSIAPG